MLTRLRLPIATLFLLAAPGCGGGTSTTTISLADYTTQWLDANCARAAQCGSYPDKATCVSSTLSPFEGQVTADIQAGKRTFDGAAASKCLEYMRAFVTAPCTFSGQATVLTDPSCLEVFKGTLADGAACSDGGQCQSGACNVTSCSGTPPCCMGTCVPTTAPIAIGGACDATGSCVSGAFCRGATGAAVCTAIIADGQPCDTTMFDFCTYGTLCMNATCQKPPSDGEICSNQCNELASFCEFQDTMTCVPKRAVGAPCPGAYGCVDHAYCDSATTTCVAKGKAGDACDTNQTGACLGALQCVNGACAFAAAPATCP